jgi:hypothetical protein
MEKFFLICAMFLIACGEPDWAAYCPEGQAAITIDGEDDYRCLWANNLINFYSNSGDDNNFMNCYLVGLPEEIEAECENADINVEANIMPDIWTFYLEDSGWLYFNYMLYEDLCAQDVLIEFEFGCKTDDGYQRYPFIGEISDFLLCDHNLIYNAKALTEENEEIYVFKFIPDEDQCSNWE